MMKQNKLLSDLAFALIAVFPYCLSLSEVLAVILTLWIYEKQCIKPLSELGKLNRSQGNPV